MENQGFEEEVFIDESGFPAELNQLNTTELLQAVGTGLDRFLNGDQFDSLGPEAAANIASHYVNQATLQQSPSELPNSTMPPTSLPTGSHPCLVDFEGEYGFTISEEVLNATGSSHSWSYSESLKQVFIKMNNVLMVQFRTKAPLDSDRFFIRALLVYQNNDFVSQPVNRCSLHWIDDDSLQAAHRTPRFCDCEKYNLAGHVLRCQTEGAHYQFDPNSDRHSVVVDIPRTPQAGSDFIKAVHYFFTCKTSCPKGMQRRAVQVVFTLEDESYQVYGRKILPVKICSCPKRDKDRMEKDSKEDLCEKKPTKRSMTDNGVDVDVKPSKIEREAALFNVQLRHATRESLETALAELVAQQQKDFDELKNRMAHMESRQNTMAEIVAQFFSNKQTQQH